MILFGRNKKIQQLEEQITNLQEELNDCRKYERRVKELEADLTNKQTIVNRVKELEQKVRESNNKDLKIKELECELLKYKSLDLKPLKKSRNNEDRIKELENELSQRIDSTTRVHELERELLNLNSAKKRICELESELAKYQKIEHIDVRVLALQTEHDDLIEGIFNLQRAISELETKKKSFNAYIDDATNFYKNIDTQEQLREIIHNFHKLNELNSDLQGRIDSLQTYFDELSNEVTRLKTEKDKYWDEKKNEVKADVMHDLYQAVFQSESDAIRLLAADVEALDISKLNEKLNLINQKYRHYWGFRGIKPLISVGRHMPLYNVLNEFLQTNISLIIKQMYNNSWETIQSKTLLILRNIEESLRAFNIEFDNNYSDIVLDYVKAKYLVVAKQRYDKQKEQEERKAQMEYERAIKKALKDEEKAQEQLEKKQREIESATNQATISKLQEQIKNLTEALLNAKELRERAMSMAQQTKSGYVYIISNIGSFGENVYKIGMTRRLDPMDRISELSNASVPFPFDVHAFIYSQDAPGLEAKLHHIFDSKKVNTVNYRKEYFRVTLDEIKAEVSRLGIVAEFQDNPDAFQYRESLRRFSFI